MTPKPMTADISLLREPSSFRDPSGFLFRHKGALYRQINRVYAADFAHLMKSGLYAELVAKRDLVPHTTTRLKPLTPDGVAVIKPSLIIPFISYPYEWSFGQLKAAALHTLRLQRIALEYGMVLKDATAYNIQFHEGQPIFIDKLSFERYREGEPWAAYRQFCQHFLAPLTLMAYCDVRLHLLLRLYIHGLPLDLTAKLLPKSTLLNPGLLIHLHLHARSQQKYAGDHTALKRTPPAMSRRAMLGLVDSLEQTVNGLRWRYAKGDTEWGDYYHQTNYTSRAFADKKKVVREWLAETKPKLIYDLGANDGEFGRLATGLGIMTVAFDVDPIAVETNYRRSGQTRDRLMLPLIIDLTNPSPGLGWHHRERQALADRGQPDLVMALALIHHLTIGNNVPFSEVARLCADLSPGLIIEFVPKEDSQVQKLLSSRKDVFRDYDETHFREAFARYFHLSASRPVKGTRRTLYLFKRRTAREV